MPTRTSLAQTSAPKDKAKQKPNGKGKSKGNAPAESKTLKRKREKDDLEKLQAAVNQLDPKTSALTKFSELPLSAPTASGLDASHFQNLTDIQARAIPLALKGQDILGAAKTGSGKTLAFLVPVIETLYRKQWTELDGLGALIIAPTRELAVQIFEVLRKIGRYHHFSAGLVIGGKSLKDEAERLARMNLLVCTPGRMLQHLDQTAGLDVDNLQILVLDEADRIMDMGFQSAVDALVEHLPKTRQTMLFSATQSKKVSDLARLSMKDPEYVAVHEAATPSTLTQHYLVTPLAEKMDTLYGFIKANLKSKIIIFLSSGKQVRFIYESFRHLQPGIPLLHLHGRQKQLARMEITRRFTSAQHSCLFATDVVARGVDFPAVDWVVQGDCPEDVDTYIHRIGRTARYERVGRAVLLLDPSEEEGMVQRLQQRKIPIQRVNVKEKKKQSIKSKIQDMCFHQPDLKYLGQKAFISYTRSIGLQKNKDVFKLDALDLQAYSESLGLPEMPPVRFQKAEDIRRLKNRSRAELSSGSEGEGEGGEGKKRTKDEVRTKYDRMFERTNQDVLSSHYSNLRPAAEDDNDFFAVKRVLNEDEFDPESKSGGGPRVVPIYGGQELVIDSKRREKLLTSKKKMLKYKGQSTKIVFDDDGEAHSLYELQGEEDFRQAGDAETQRQRFVQAEADRVREADLEDKQLAKEKRQEKKVKRKERERMEANDEMDAAEQPTLGGSGDADAALDFLRSLPIAGEEAQQDEDDERPRKKPKKWFEDDSDDEKPKSKKGRKVIEVTDAPDTLEDLEALATGLLDD
ncbi:P-loop containing nucleoside triphosphate hydrolase protein [Pseudomassariella vexata]|uniref:ATP-dependent RNA helicase n=1 Tax=Pseudomassariella vexata TaxID=1141098 RepID=A0A1Y2DFJ3_9PEZI|nr:P-loop containing nucleoside triphosphate hydrolase protein [Pseudomassariella vexata]ORY58028.1 P-loop containing nucleoside triphosphate hydrolase protein [Pseudomassariella vexata]